VEDTPYAVRGVYRNVLPLNPSSKIRVGVFCLSKSLFPVGILALQSEFFHLSWVLLHAQSRWTSWLRSNLPSILIVSELPLHLDVEWVFCEGRPPGSSSPVWSSLAPRILIATNTPSRAAHRSSAWVMQKYVILHTHVGGATSHVSNVFLFHRDLTRSRLLIDAMPSRTVSSVVDATVHGATCDPRIPFVTQLGSVDDPLHWTQPRCRYCMPSVFSPTGFVARRLTPHELLAAADFPLAFVKHLPAVMAGLIFKYVHCPLKIHQAVLGGLLRSRAAGSVSELPNASLPALPQALEPPSVMPTTGGDNSQPVVVQNVLNRDSFRELYDNSKATKSDDAGVPVLIWDGRINGGNLTSSEMEALNGLRLLGLCWWKKQVSSSFWKWLRKLTIKDTLLSRGTSCNYLLFNSYTKTYKWNSTGLQWYRRWHRRLYQSQTANMNAARECIHRAANSSWWEWDAGSRPLF